MTEQNEHLALWGGRFSSGPSPELARLSKSTQFDWRLADDDIAGSRAHARALGRAGLLTADELNRMEEALDELQRRVDSGEMKVAFALYPVSMKQLINIADSGKIMPPKTTWFEPKLRSGIVIHEF